MTGAAANAELEERRLRWRCRRGVQELDVLLERYARTMLPRAPPSERCALARLLERPDPELLDYLVAGVLPADPELAALSARIAAATAPPSPVADPARYGACSISLAMAAGRDGA